MKRISRARDFQLEAERDVTPEGDIERVGYRHSRFLVPADPTVLVTNP